LERLALLLGCASDHARQVHLMVKKTVEGRADLCEVDGSDFDQSQDESGDEVCSSWVENEMAFQDVLEGFMLHLATFPARDLVALFLCFCVGDATFRLLSSS
jgi:hypothetical protein